ncbi:MAG: site-specific integrase [Proteobacteria bacterium]|nr:site-specific integrase [Pseudomonadota bacterium]
MPYFDKTSGKYRATKMINGKRKNKMFKSKSEAKRWEAQQTEGSWSAVQPNLVSVSLLEWSVEYPEYSKQRHTPKTYLEEKVPAFNRLFEAIPNTTPVTDLTVTACLKILTLRAQDVSGNAANKDRKNLAAAWTWGTKYLGMPRDNPFVAVDRFPSDQQARYMPPESDFWKVYEVARPKDQVFLLTLLHTGARRSELLRLTWDDINLDTGMIRLWTRKRANGSLEFDWLWLTSRLHDALQKHYEQRISEHVFCRSDGTPYKWRQHLMKILCKRAGVKHFTFHGIRHLLASKMAQKGVDIPNIRDILRHTNSMTTTRYIHRLGITKNVLEDVFGQPES